MAVLWCVGNLTEDQVELLAKMVDAADELRAVFERHSMGASQSPADVEAIRTAVRGACRQDELTGEIVGALVFGDDEEEEKP